MKRKILLVDDCKSALNGMQRCLCNWNENILSAETGSAALEILANNDVAIIISDYKLPDINGIELLEQSKIGYPDCRRILLTGFPDLYAAINAVNRGEIYRFLTKPYNPLELREIIADVFDPELNKENIKQIKNELLVSRLEESYPGISNVSKSDSGAIDITMTEEEFESIFNSLKSQEES